ncbi:MAG: hypothetical protein AAB319_07755, partial [Pseudomonadota bacterium]
LADLKQIFVGKPQARGRDCRLVSLPRKLDRGLTGLGGLIVVIGGVMFVLVCVRAMINRPPK